MKGTVGKAFVVVVAILSLVVAASAGFAAETVKVGVLLPLTGSQAKFGEIEKRSYEMAAEEINAKGGVNGKKIELLFEDDTGKPDVGRSGVEKLISREKVPVITGGYSSSVTAAAAPVAQQFKVPFVICTGSADDVTEKGYDYVFRVNPPASEYPNAVKSFLQSVAKDVKTVALLYENSAFGQSSSKSFEEDAKGVGLKIIVKEGYQAGAIDFKPVLTKVKAANPDMIYMVSYVMDASLLMRQSKELHINPKMFVGGGAGFTLPEFAKSAGDAADGVYSATLWVETLPFPGAKAVFRQLQEEVRLRDGVPRRGGVRHDVRRRGRPEAGEEHHPQGRPGRLGQDRHEDRLRAGQVRLLRQEDPAEQARHVHGPVAEGGTRGGVAYERGHEEVHLPDAALGQAQVTRPGRFFCT